MPAPPRPAVRHLVLPGRLRLEFAEQGRPGGPTLLLLHGTTDSWRSFESLMPHLPPDWHVIAPSQRGHGGSDRPEHGYRMRDFADDAVALVRALGLPPVIVAGHSMGAAIAMRIAADHPQHVRALVGMASFADFRDRPDLEQFVAAEVAPLVDPVPRAVAEAFQRSTVATAVPEPFMQEMIDQSLMLPAAVWRDVFAALLDDDYADGLHRIAAPTLLLHGGADSLVPDDDLARLLRAIPQATSQAWPGIGHALHWDAPQRAAKAIAAFVAELD